MYLQLHGAPQFATRRISQRRSKECPHVHLEDPSSPSSCWGSLSCCWQGAHATAADGCKRGRGKDYRSRLPAEGSASGPHQRGRVWSALSRRYQGQFFRRHSQRGPVETRPLLFTDRRYRLHDAADGSTLSSQDRDHAIRPVPGVHGESSRSPEEQGGYAGATGTLVTTGTVSLATGGSGTYSGQILPAISLTLGRPGH